MPGRIILPRRGRGRQSATALAEYEAALHAFCDAILQIQSTLDFVVSSRGWCYILEEHGLLKGEFNAAQTLLAECRKRGLLPLDIVADDMARSFDCVERTDTTTPEEQAQLILNAVNRAHERYAPISFWQGQEYYIQMMVEKVDLKSLFKPICDRYRIPIANARGWSDLNTRAHMMARFMLAENEGQTPVILYAGDHDPAGLAISTFLRRNLQDLEDAVGWSPDNLIIDRFGLNADFIEAQDLSWIDNLETGSGRRLDDPRHPDHQKPYVQQYLERYGARKVEANALVVRPEAGRRLCLDAVLKYLPEDAPEQYQSALGPYRNRMRDVLHVLLAEGLS